MEFHKLDARPPKFYKLAERPLKTELREHGFGDPGEGSWTNPFRPDFTGLGLVAIKTGEKRSPKRGEWYLSGAIPEAYKAPNDLPGIVSVYILKLVRVKTTLVTELMP